MTVGAVGALRLSRTVAATPEEAFDAWTQPDQMKRWACPEGLTVDDVQADLRVGGAYRLVMKNPEGGTHTAVGSYRSIERPSRIVYSWDWEEEPMRMGDTTVTVTFEPSGDSTVVTLVHEGFPNVELKGAHEEGWTGCMDRYVKLF